jgi:basic membrane lipoprotein Med (substrate-binding protein (PBP1-ABC) superfamily)
MKRSSGVLCGVIGVIVLLTGCKQQEKSQQVEKRKPNIVFILADDLG